MATFPIAIRNMQLRIQNAQLIASLSKDTGHTLTTERARRFEFATYSDVRGIPAIGPNCPGRIAGTRPDAIADRDHR